MQQELNGIIVIDKPADITSAKVAAFLKKLLRPKKVGHAGTLDPFATGVLICCLNQATRLARFFLNGNKKYDAVLQLGIDTDTQDPTGNIISKCERIVLSDKEIKSTIKRFEGPIEQVPPVYSALKHKGVPLYRLARAGKPFQKSARRVYIESIQIVDISLPYVRLKISCSAGTYIRTLCADIGRVLGCGGHLKSLRRIECGRFSIKEAVSMDEIEKLAGLGKVSDKLVDMASALRGMPEVTVGQEMVAKIRNGAVLSEKEFMPENNIESNGYVKIVDRNKNLISVLDIDGKFNQVKYCCVFS